ncbi:MAG: DNA internalization-related competence protein ComEC/Rec2 [Betaproteobacteria bacterium]
MTAALLSFAAGVLALQGLPVLPAVAWIALALPAAAGMAWKRALAVPLAAVLGFCWALGFAHLRLADRLNPELEGLDVEAVGVVAGLPAAGERSLRFAFDVESSSRPLPPRVLVSWYRSPFAQESPSILAEAPHPGERWRFTLRLKRPHGHFNPHGFDYEGWLLERGIGATGYVRAGGGSIQGKGAPLRMGWRNGFSDRIEQAREAIRDRFRDALGATPAGGILVALAVGDQRAIANEEWRLFAATGVTHLMSISGLHVTLVSGLFAWLVASLWRRVPRLALALPARKAGALAAIAGALGYTLLAGFAVPAQRTFWMVTVVALALWSGRIASPARTLALALAVVLLFDPWAGHSAGFWLSFGAVALIFLVGIAVRRDEPVLLQWARIQWAITIGLAPAALFLFSQVSLVGPLANAVAIPVVSVVVTPLALAAAALPWDALLSLAAWLVEWLLQFLEWCASLPVAVWQQPAPPLWCLVAAIAGAVWLVAPSGIPWRATGLALMAPAFAWPVAGPAPGEAWVVTLDAGQGLAVLVRTANRALLYDAGPAFGTESDSGERIILLYLRAIGVSRLDALVVTHNDIDHSGGAASVLQALEVDRFLSSLPERSPLLALAPAQRCVAGQAWDWDGVRFEVLHPAAGARERRTNNLSCVLRVAARGGAMLLTGDIEREAEATLVDRNAQALRAEVLLVPHHGSRTSSSEAFIAAVAPRVAVLPVGYRNRFGHPATDVAGRYAAAGAALRRTDLEGALEVRLSARGAEIAGERERRRRYWHDAPP